MHNLTISPSADIEPFTGLPRLTRALADISLLTRQLGANQNLGIVSLFIPPSPAIYRLTPETAHDLRHSISQRLGSVLRPSDRLYSITHWEWLILMPGLLSTALLTLAMLRLRGSLGEPVATLDGTALTLDGHCGGALWPDDGSDPPFLLQSARIARLYAGHNDSGIETYRPGMDAQQNEHAQFANDLPQALASNSPQPLCLYLQPQIRLADGRCTAAEALLRWPQADGSTPPPLHIIAALDKLDLRHQFSRWLLNQSMQIITELDRAGIGIPISINLSAHDLLDIELPDQVAQALATWDVAPQRLRLEITETMMVEESPQVSEVIARLRRLGVTLAIDDFGTGYAGMTYLQRLPVDEVKIDQRFVRQATGSKRDREIIASVAQLSHRLNLSVLAEGVEDAHTAEVLKELGCEFAQGFLYSRAVPLAEFIEWYRRQPE